MYWQTDGQTDRQMQALNIIVAAEVLVPGIAWLKALCAFWVHKLEIYVFFFYILPINLHSKNHFWDQKW